MEQEKKGKTKERCQQIGDREGLNRVAGKRGGGGK